MQVQTPLWTPVASWAAPESFPNLGDAKLISVDLETCDPELRKRGPGGVRSKGHVAGVAIATDTGFCGYFPYNHAMGGNLDKGKVLSWISEVMALPIPKVGANLLYDMEWLRHEGIEMVGPFYDIQIAEPLLDEEKPRGFSLEILAQDYLKEGKDETLLNQAAQGFGVHPKTDMHILPAKYVGQYAEADARLALEIFQLQQQKLKDQLLWPVFELEASILPIILDMRFKGVQINENAAHELIKNWEIRERTLLDELNHIAGSVVSPWSNDDLARVCVKKGYPFPRTSLGNASFTGEWLEAQESEFFKILREVRRINKLCHTFVRDQILNNVHHGRIHAQFHPMRKDDGGTRSGRFSSSNPNLQQIPSRTEESKAIRNLFVPENNKLWAKFDYSQQEPRLLVHYAVRRGLSSADDARFKYTDNPRTDFYNVVVELAGITRDQAKTIYLARSYGMGIAKLARNLNVSVDEARELSRQIGEAVPFIRELSDDVARRAANRGYIITLGGRHRHFNFWEPSDRQLMEGEMPLSKVAAGERWPRARLKRAHTHKALNALIQGSAADMTKMAMLKIYREMGLVPHIQVHDELNYSVESETQAREIKRCMETCVELTVPIVADLSIGPSWGECKKVKD